MCFPRYYPKIHSLMSICLPSLLAGLLQAERQVEWEWLHFSYSTWSVSPPPPSPGAQMVRLQGVEKESEGRSWLLNQGWWASQLTQWLIPWTILLRLLNVTSLYAISLHQKGRHSLGIPESIGSQFFLWPSSECDHSSFRRILFRWNSKFPPDLWSLEPLFIEEDHLCF